MAHGIWTIPFRTERLKFIPIEEGTETSGHPKNVFEHGDWVVLGFVEPTRPMDWEEFLDTLYPEREKILERVFEGVRSNLKKMGYDIERSYKPLFHVEEWEYKPSVWYVVKKNGEPIAYCELIILEGEIGLPRSRPYAEVSIVCLKVSKSSKK